MKKLLICVLAGIFVISAVSAAGGSQPSGGTAGAAAPQKVINMRLAHYAAADHPGGIAAREFADGVKTRTNGAIVIDVFPNNELGNPDEMLEQNIQGVLDMTLGTQGSLDKYSKKFCVVMLPFVFNDYDHAYRVLDGPFYDWVKDEMLAHGLVFIGAWDYGFRNLTNSVRPINTPDDVSGLKIRTPGEIQLQMCMSSLGGNVQAIPFGELYLALKQGTVEGQENPLSVIYFNKYYEAQKYLALTKHVYNSMNLVVSKKVWDTLSPQFQTIIREESKKAAASMRNATKNGDETYIANLEKQGMIVTRPNTALFAAKMQPAYDAIAKYAGNPDYIPTFLKMVADKK